VREVGRRDPGQAHAFFTTSPNLEDAGTAEPNERLGRVSLQATRPRTVEFQWAGAPYPGTASGFTTGTQYFALRGGPIGTTIKNVTITGKGFGSTPTNELNKLAGNMGLGALSPEFTGVQIMMRRSSWERQSL
jgi:hypothetical protein